jgi:LysR family glycine cleavage system transcriptional activator
MSQWLPSLNALRAFEAVSRHLSYRQAAEELSVTPAAVKQLVQGLERSLDRSLLRRQGRGLALTEIGMAGLADLHHAFDRLHRAVTKMRRVERRQSLTISVEPSFAGSWLMKRLQGFKAQYPDVDVLIDGWSTSREKTLTSASAMGRNPWRAISPTGCSTKRSCRSARPAWLPGRRR